MIDFRTVCRGFGIRRPRIAVAGLNPHAGEGGLLGDEERRVITPAVKRATQRGIVVSGPHSADTLFYRAAHGEFDAVVAMYHDQGLGPFKLIAFDSGVNLHSVCRLCGHHRITARRPILPARVSTHPDGMIAAINMAARLVRTR